MKQNSDTRARRQHSTVPVEKGLSTLRLICGLTGNIVRPGSTETPSSMNCQQRCCSISTDVTTFATATSPPNFRSSRWRAKRPREASLIKVGCYGWRR